MNHQLYSTIEVFLRALYIYINIHNSKDYSFNSLMGVSYPIIFEVDI